MEIGSTEVIKTKRGFDAMCGRFTLQTSAEKLVQIFALSRLPEWSARFNIAPTQEILAIRAGPDQSRDAAPVRWGLVPSWAKDTKIGHKMINARSETVHEKPVFRSSFERRRCLIVADGYYEWRTIRNKKIPSYIYPVDNQPMALAGIWSVWRDPESGAALTTAAILTTRANTSMATIHHRMPVILIGEERQHWLDIDLGRNEIADLLEPAPDDLLSHHVVSTRVNRPRDDDPGLIEPEDISKNDQIRLL
jgi:putative SOS response-associated peptidase YedK